jgi:hypothetical protein
MGRRKMMEPTLFKKIIKYKIQWEMKKMNAQFLTLNRTMINVTKVPSDAHKNKQTKKTLKEETLEEISATFMQN